MNKYNAIFIGRFQPFHDGHYSVIKKILTDKNLNKFYIFIGSCNLHRSTKNPWTDIERYRMITRTIEADFSDDILNKVVISFLNDYPYNDNLWITEFREKLNDVINDGTDGIPLKIVACRKDSSSYYIDLFPEFETIEFDALYGTFNATDIREQYFQDAPIISEFVPFGTRHFLKDFVLSKQFKWILDEFKHVRSYKQKWKVSPWPPIFMTSDNVVIQSGNILLVTRKESPYKGALALPGGFVNQNETMIECAVRELKEETKISDHMGEIPKGRLKSFITKRKIFDHPDRSARGRTITEAFLYELPNKKPLYSVIGSDDAEHARWYKLSELKTNMFMEDHAFIIEDMVGVSL